MSLIYGRADDCAEFDQSHQGLSYHDEYSVLFCRSRFGCHVVGLPPSVVGLVRCGPSHAVGAVPLARDRHARRCLVKETPMTPALSLRLNALGLFAISAVLLFAFADQFLLSD